MQCFNCGKPITAQMISCSFCGVMLHPPATPAPADPAANPYAVNSYDNQFAYANPYTPGAQPSWMPPMAPQQPASKRLGARWAIALSVVLLILLVLVGGSVLAYTLITRPYVQKAQAQAQAHSTATAVANQANTYFQQLSQQPPTLTGSAAALWSTYQETNSSCQPSGTSVTVSIDEPHSYNVCLNSVTHTRNFAFQTTMTVFRGDGGGLIFHVSNKGNSGDSWAYYYFEISYFGYYSLYRITPDHTPRTTQLDTGYTAAMLPYPDSHNTFLLIARNNTCYLYVNKNFVSQTSDRALTGDGVGVLVEEDQAPSSVTYDQTQVWNLGN